MHRTDARCDASRTLSALGRAAVVSGVASAPLGVRGDEGLLR
jgi:hypothetical protein